MIAPVIGLTLGLGLGTVHLWLLRATTQLFAQSGSWQRAALLYAVRLALTAGGLWLIAQAGAVVLLAALAGFLAARSLMLMRLVSRYG